MARYKVLCWLFVLAVALSIVMVGYAGQTKCTLPGQLPTAQQMLSAIALANDIELAKLRLVTDVVVARYDTIQRCLYTAKAIEVDTGCIYTAYLDEAGNLADASLYAADSAAYQAQYGKLSPDLYDFLQAHPDQPMVRIGVRLRPAPGAGPLRKPDGDLTDEQVARFLQGNQRALQQRANAARDSIVITLGNLGYQPLQVDEFSPLVYYQVPPSLVEMIAAHADVVEVFLSLEGQEEKRIPEGPGQYNKGAIGPGMDIQRCTVGADALWALGITGQGIVAGVVEGSAAVTQNVYLTGKVFNREPNCQGDHPTATSGIVVAQHDTYRGIAYDATVALGNACSWLDSGLQAGTNWAIGQGARVINYSWYNGSNGILNAYDRWIDEQIENQFVTFVKSAGNQGNNGPCTNPGLAYGIITVGSINDHRTCTWADDSLSWFSSCGDPLSVHGDREKPELTAPGEDIIGMTTHPPWFGSIGSGTSYAAPVVAAGVAQLQQRKPVLKIWPEAIKAILMSSARHNLESEEAFQPCTDNQVLDNVVHDNGWHGILIQGGRDNLLQGNKVFAQVIGSGLRIEDLTGPAGSLASDNNQVIYNFIMDNALDGVEIRSKGITGIHNNAICGNTQFQVANWAASTQPAQGNWYGTNDDPMLAGLIAGNVAYSPWLHMALSTSSPYAFVGEPLTVSASFTAPGGYVAPDGLYVDWQTVNGIVVPSRSYTEWGTGMATTAFTAERRGTAAIAAVAQCQYPLTITVPCYAHLPPGTFTKTAERNSVPATYRIRYTLTLNSIPGETLDNVTIGDTLPPFTYFDSASPPPSFIADENIYWDIGTLAPGSGVQIRLTVGTSAAAAGRTVTNQARVLQDGVTVGTASVSTYISALPAPTPTPVQECLRGDLVDYAPVGMPDFDQRQTGFTIHGQWVYGGPAAAADALWYMDSHNEPNPQPVDVVSDGYPLVPSFASWDDHDPRNVPALITRLATAFHVSSDGTSLDNLVAGLRSYIAGQGLSDALRVDSAARPTPDMIRENVLRGVPMIALLGFWELQDGHWVRLGGNYVGLCCASLASGHVAIADPYHDCSVPTALYTQHNDARFVSYDRYELESATVPGAVLTLKGYVQDVGSDALYFAGQNFAREQENYRGSYRGGRVIAALEYIVSITEASGNASSSPMTKVTTTNHQASQADDDRFVVATSVAFSASSTQVIATNDQMAEAIPHATSETTTLYVDPTGSCSGHLPCFTTIGTALAAASANDTIIIYPGLYSEAVTVTQKGLTLQGAGCGQTVLDGLTGALHSAVTLLAPEVTITGLEIRNFAGPGIVANCPAPFDGFHILTNCIHHCGGPGILFLAGSQSLVQGNEVYSNGEAGIALIAAQGAAWPSECEGAGGVDLARADTVVVADQYEFGTFTPAGPWPYSRQVALVAGQHVRTVLCWDATHEYSGYYSEPAIDLDLQVYGPDGTYLAGGYSLDNTYELVEFDVPTTGNYHFRISNSRWSPEAAFTYYGLAWCSQ